MGIKIALAGNPNCGYPVMLYRNPVKKKTGAI